MKKTTVWHRRGERVDSNTGVTHQGRAENRTQVRNVKVITKEEGRECKSRGVGEL